MKLDRECVRDVLLLIESFDREQVITSDELLNLQALNNYGESTILYTVEKLDEAGFVNVKFMPVLGGENPFFLQSITWEGHQFLDTIRDPAIWRETKSIASKVASASLTVLSDVAAGVMKKTLGLE
ncbi:DUF2513 domain-containing protein [Paenibacillus sp. M1]|uniref:DUF2513 domain-containing protein n=1 Tax=Paenibacillus haidiansis TaxID=1574488 RepID=A0ABU7VPB5_9BACL